ncbi:MAG TPA: TrbC/VirB2 family protein [Caulobacteraceae bacterium]|jgi:type IV secretion system protein VirB2|nr:TrbC/VirB2 family protein [Caulobacteraceae bacterium]
MRLTHPLIRPRGGARSFGVLAALAGALASASPAAAATGGGVMPWDNILTTVQADLTGPVAVAVGVVCCVVFGLSMAFGHEGSAMKRGMSILFGLAIAFSSTTGLLTIFGAGTGATF